MLLNYKTHRKISMRFAILCTNSDSHYRSGKPRRYFQIIHIDYIPFNRESERTKVRTAAASFVPTSLASRNSHKKQITPSKPSVICFTVHQLRQLKPKWEHSRWLLQSFPVAHANACLVLLRSSSDTVRSMTLHGTLLSSLLAMRNQP